MLIVLVHPVTAVCERHRTKYAAPTLLPLSYTLAISCLLPSFLLRESVRSSVHFALVVRRMSSPRSLLGFLNCVRALSCSLLQQTCIHARLLFRYLLHRLENEHARGGAWVCAQDHFLLNKTYMQETSLYQRKASVCMQICVHALDIPALEQNVRES